jgi:hypothetical protein
MERLPLAEYPPKLFAFRLIGLEPDNPGPVSVYQGHIGFRSGAQRQFADIDNIDFLSFRNKVREAELVCHRPRNLESLLRRADSDGTNGAGQRLHRSDPSPASILIGFSRIAVHALAWC